MRQMTLPRYLASVAISLILGALEWSSAVANKQAAQATSSAAASHATHTQAPTPRDMVLIAGGRFAMGCQGCNLADAEPVHLVDVSSFWMDATPVTNANFQTFVTASHYVTVAERKPKLQDFPGVDPARLVAGSAVFSPPSSLDSLAHALAWWRYVPGANWRRPEGPKSSIANRRDHPVVHIAYADAAAYCLWLKRRLPTEAEYEFAARGGLEGKRYAWGDELEPMRTWRANIWQGDFPVNNTAADGFSGTSPVRAFPPNGFGLFDMGGNVWQWTSDWYRIDTYAKDAARGVVRNPKGPSSSHDPAEPGVAKRVQRGGSFLCSERYCSRFLVGSRGKGEADSAGSNVGFRCAKDL